MLHTHAAGQAKSWVEEALSLGWKDCPLCGGPAPKSKPGSCRGCSNPDHLDEAVEADLDQASDGTPPKPTWDTPLEP